VQGGRELVGGRQRRLVAHRLDRREHRDAAGMPELQRAAGVDRMKDVFDGDRVRTALLEQYREARVNLQEFLGERGLRESRDGAADDDSGAERDQSDLEYVYTVFSYYGPELNYGSTYPPNIGRGGNSGANFTTVMTATDPMGQQRGFLASEENYRVLRELEGKNLLIPIVGDFGGPKALRAVGQYLKDHGVTVTAYYTSNVEQYLFNQNSGRGGNGKTTALVALTDYLASKGIKQTLIDCDTENAGQPACFSHWLHGKGNALDLRNPIDRDRLLTDSAESGSQFVLADLPANATGDISRWLQEVATVELIRELERNQSQPDPDPRFPDGQ